MSRKTIITGALVALVSLALLATAAVAARGDGAGYGRTGGMGRAACRMGDRGMRPSFTAGQKDQMEEIRTGFEDERVELQNRMKVLHMEMQEIAEADNPDFSKLERMIDEVAGLRAETMKIRLKQHRAIRKILNDDQRVLFDRGFTGMLARGGDRGGRGARCGGRAGCAPMGRPGMMGASRSWETQNGEVIEILRGPGGGRGERRIIVEKIIEDENA